MEGSTNRLCYGLCGRYKLVLFLPLGNGEGGNDLHGVLTKPANATGGIEHRRRGCGRPYSTMRHIYADKGKATVQKRRKR